MKQHFFYTILVISVITAVVTLLGLTGVVSIADGFLTALVSAFLVASAGVLVAIAKKTEFFTEDAGELSRIRAEDADTLKRLEVSDSQITRFQSEIDRLQQDNQELQQRLERVSSLRFRILSILGSSSADRVTLLGELGLHRNTPEGNLALDVVGKLVDDKEIEQDPYKPTGYYRLRKD